MGQLKLVCKGAVHTWHTIKIEHIHIDIQKRIRTKN